MPASDKPRIWLRGGGAELTRFVGRRSERAEVRRLLSVSRLVTITGIGGVGKTRLAVRCGTDVSRAFRNGVWFVDLSTLSDETLLPDTVATALGLGTTSSGRTLAALIDHLVDSSALVVLDNCEHVLDGCADLVARLLHSCPDLHVLATSRQPLGILGEAVLAVAPLPVPAVGADTTCDSVTLFADRAAMACPGVQLDDDTNSAAVAEICRRLEGIPLALELAAVRLRALGPSQLLDQISSRFQLLNSGNRGAPERQRTLHNCIDWSYELCTPQEKALWAKASVFSGSLDIEAVTAVCGEGQSETEILEVLLSLVNKSVLTCEPSAGQMCYRMLETIREYGRAKLRASGELTETCRRHCRYFLDMATRSEAQWATSDQSRWITRLSRNWANLSAALQFCVDHPEYAEAGLRAAVALSEQWLTMGAVGEGRHWLDTLMASAAKAEAHVLCQALCTVARLAMTQGDLTTGSAYIERGRGLSARLDAESQAYLDQAAAMRALYRGQWSDALDFSARAMTQFQRTDAVADQLTCMMIAQMAHGEAGDREQALALHHECLRLSQRAGEAWFRSMSVWNAGVSAWTTGDTDTALRMIRQALRMKNGFVDVIGMAACLESVAWVLSSHETQRAIVLLGAASVHWERSGAVPAHLAVISAHHDRCVERLTAACGARRYASLYEEGRRLSREDAIALALDEKTRTATQKRGADTLLTRREREVAQLVAQGLSNKDIAQSLVIAQRTAETHVGNILVKCGFSSRTELAAWMLTQQQL